MNELLASIEAMIRRIVKEELELVPMPAPAPMPTMALFDAVRATLMNREGTLFHDLMIRYLADGGVGLDAYITDHVTNDSYIHDHITGTVQNTEIDDFNQKVRAAVNDMSFTVTVD